MWVSYAQALEDIHLMRCLSDVRSEDGFYIDVGAWHPEIDSVTKLFYDAGWRGINIEPSPTRFPLFVEQRPRDINLQLAIAERAGEIVFYDDPHGGLGTLVEEVAACHNDMQKVTVRTDSLTAVCDAYAQGDIHFLKIDVEGAEEVALRSLDLSRYRAWVLCIESHFPLRTDIQTYGPWEPYVIDGGYRFAYADPHGINRYYIAEERGHCGDGFRVPADYYIPARTARRLDDLERIVSQIRHALD